MNREKTWNALLWFLHGDSGMKISMPTVMPCSIPRSGVDRRFIVEFDDPTYMMNGEALTTNLPRNNVAFHFKKNEAWPWLLNSKSLESQMKIPRIHAQSSTSRQHLQESCRDLAFGNAPPSRKSQAHFAIGSHLEVVSLQMLLKRGKNSKSLIGNEGYQYSECEEDWKCPVESLICLYIMYERAYLAQ